MQELAIRLGIAGLGRGEQDAPIVFRPAQLDLRFGCNLKGGPGETSFESRQGMIRTSGNRFSGQACGNKEREE